MTRSLALLALLAFALAVCTPCPPDTEVRETHGTAAHASAAADPASGEIPASAWCGRARAEVFLVAPCTCGCGDRVQALGPLDPVALRAAPALVAPAAVQTCAVSPPASIDAAPLDPIDHVPLRGLVS